MVDLRRRYLCTLYLDTWVPGYTWVHLSLTLCMQAVNLDHELPNQPSTDVPESVSKRLSFRDKVIIMIIMIIIIIIVIIIFYVYLPPI